MSEHLWNMVKALYAVESLQGYTQEEINLLREIFGSLPQELEEYYRIAGNTKEFRQGQDIWMLPEHFQKWKWLGESEYMILLNENQSVCRAGIRREDLSLPDPPVYVFDDDGNRALCAPAVSEFLPAMLAYQAAFRFEYCPEEFYWLTQEEFSLIQSRLTKLPFELAEWIGGIKITLYQNAADNLVVVMDGGDGDLSMLYGAAGRASYQRLREVLEGVGEAM